MRLRFVYQPGNSFFHRLNPITKIIWILSIGIIVWNTKFLVIIFIFSILSLIIAGKTIGLRNIFFQIGWILGFFIIIIPISIVYTVVVMMEPIVDPELFYLIPYIKFSLFDTIVEFGPWIKIEYEGIWYALLRMGQLLTLSVIGAHFALTTHPKDLVYSTITLIPYRFAYAFQLAFRYVETIQIESSSIMTTRRLRGFTFAFAKAKWYHKFNLMLNLAKSYLISLLVVLLRRSDVQGTSMDKRLFGFSKKRMNLFYVSLHKKDILIIILLILFVIFSLLYLNTSILYSFLPPPPSFRSLLIFLGVWEIFKIFGYVIFWIVWVYFVWFLVRGLKRFNKMSSKINSNIYYFNENSTEVGEKNLNGYVYKEIVLTNGNITHIDIPLTLLNPNNKEKLDIYLKKRFGSLYDNKVTNNLNIFDDAWSLTRKSFTESINVSTISKTEFKDDEYQEEYPTFEIQNIVKSVEDSAITLKNLKYRFNFAPKVFFNGLNLKIPRGSFTVITGPSGSGKSTLAKVFSGVIPHDGSGKMAGKVIIKNKYSTNERTIQEISLDVGLVQQDPESQLCTYTVLEEIAFGLENKGVPIIQIIPKVKEALATINASYLYGRNLYSLSSGEKQSVVLAACIALGQDIIVLDEPTAYLDFINRRQFLQTLKSLQKRGMTIILCEHRVHEVLDYADRIIVLDEGKIVLDGPKDEIINNNYEYLFNLGLRINNTLNKITDIAEDKIDEIIKKSQINLVENDNNQNRLPKIPFNEIIQPNCVKEPLMKLKGIYYRYPGTIHDCLTNMSFELLPGEITMLAGRNGAGKSTLCNILIGMIEPDKGEIYFLGRNKKEIKDEEFSRKIGFIYQNPELQISCPHIDEDILYSPINYGLVKTIDDFGTEHFNSFCKFIGVDPADTKRSPWTLSWGQKRRLTIVGFVAVDPEILILDEPFIGQDQNNIIQIMQYLKSYTLQRKSILLVTHDLDMIAQYGDNLYVMHDGMITNNVQGNNNIKKFIKLL